jgi:outer membrane receptor protein involved in Fe transport
VYKRQGYEWTINDHNSLSIDGRIVWSGGERKVPLDYEASAREGEAVYDVERVYQERFPFYFRTDLRISYKLNRKTSHTFAVDIINLTNRVNHYLSLYNAEINDYEEVSMLGLMPSVLWRWNF